MGKINTDNYPNRPFSAYQDDDMFILQDNGGETYTTNVGDIKNLADSRIKLEGVQVNGTDLPISGKKVNVDISGKTDLSVIAYTFNSEMGYFKGAYVTYNGKLYEFIQEHTGAWNPSHVREIRATGQYVRTGNGGYNNGDRATCEGYMTKASGNYSHAEGRETQAVGECTHAEGRETIANGIYQHVEGKYNVVDNESKYIHIIGNGIDANNRHNAFAIDWDGNVEASGEIEDGNGEKISDKTDKVADATSGHLAGLDSNGNLTDSGVSPTEEVTVEGNPVTFDSPFEQDAKSVVVSVEPIQDLHGYDHPWVGGAGKNKCESYVATASTEQYYTALYIETDLQASTTYAISFDDIAGNNFYANENVFVGDVYIATINGRNSVVVTTKDNLAKDQTTYENGKGWIILKNMFAQSVTPDISRVQVELGSTTTPYAPYSNICPISGIDEVEIEVSDGEGTPTTTTIPLPQTVYDGEVDVTNGSGNSTHAIVDLGDLDYEFISGYNFMHSTNLSGAKDQGSAICSCYEYSIGVAPGATVFTIYAGQFYVSDSGYTDAAAFKAAMAGQKLCYELATPTTLSLTPTDVELLEGTNVVSTNGEKVAVTYGRSLWQDIDELKTDTEGKLNKSDVATIEGDTASKAYSVNDFMLRSDGFYKVTQPIAQNASITASNTTKTTVGEVLTALLNA